MRKIKFRQWCNRDKEFHYWGFLEGESEFFENPLGYMSKDNPRESQQFTGLKDQNGKEIYEGDIVDMFQSKDKNENKCIGFIVFEKGNYLIKWINKNSDGWGRGIIESWLKVIGNIYENPELLKGL